MSQPLSLMGPPPHHHGGGHHGGGIDRTFFGGGYQAPYIVEQVVAPSTSGTFLDSLGIPAAYQNYVLIALAALALYGAYKFGSGR